jgi:hypothetical protein
VHSPNNDIVYPLLGIYYSILLQDKELANYFLIPRLIRKYQLTHILSKNALAVCCASRLKSQKIADQAFFSLTNCQAVLATSSP